MTDNKITVRITRTRDVEVCADTFEEAQQIVEEIYLCGEGCAELEDATYEYVPPKTLMVIPVSSGETFTAYSNSIGDYVEGQEGITLEQLKVLGDVNDVETDIDDMSPTERYLWLVDDVGYYTFDTLAIVDSSKMDMLEEASNATCDEFGGSDSSSVYEAFNRTVIALAEKTIPFYNEDVIKVDPNY